MRTPKDKELAAKRQEAAVRRMHRRVASEEFERHGTPKAVTMRRLQRSRAATVGNKARWARERRYKERTLAEYNAEHPPVNGAASMHKGILNRITQMDRHERMERARLGMGLCLLTYNRPADFNPQDEAEFEDWQARTLRALTYQRGKYRKLETHTEAQADAHVLLELCIDWIRQGSAPLLAKWLHTRQVAEREEASARRRADADRLKLHNPTAGFSI